VKSVTKGGPPPQFLQWLALAGLNWRPSYRTLSGPPMVAVRTALLREQGYLCAYCGRALAVDGADSHNEHFFPQSKFRDWELEWWNLFASCGPQKVRHRPKTCGDAKDNWTPSPHFIIPSDPSCEDRFRYDGIGQIAPTVATDLAATAMISKLNLKEPSLTLERQQLIAALEQDIADGHINPATVPTEIALWRTTDPQGRLKGFAQVAIRYLAVEPLI
jgi:uncharacterized protein (TIGR02646 family)